MNDKLRLNDIAIGSKIRRFQQAFNPEILGLKGVYHTEHWRDGKLFRTYVAENTIVNVGKNYILDVMFNDGTQIANNKWFMGFISSSGYSAIAAGDTMASHSGWTEWTTYSQSVRQNWSSGAAASQSVTNGTAVVIDITGSGTVKGLFIVGGASGADTKSGTGGTLWSAALYTGGDVAVINGDQLRSTYTINA
jgi:hypothetical protein